MLKIFFNNKFISFIKNKIKKESLIVFLSNIFLYLYLILSLLCFIIIFVNFLSISNLYNNNFKDISKNWEIELYESLDDDFKNLNFCFKSRVDLPINFENFSSSIFQRSIYRGKAIVRKSININEFEDFKESELFGIFIGKLIDSSEIYINGTKVAEYGKKGNFYFSAWNKNISISLPNFYKQNKNNINDLLIEIVIYYNPTGSVQDNILIGDYNFIERIKTLNNFIDVDLKIVFLILIAILAILFYYLGINQNIDYYYFFSILTFEIIIFSITYIFDFLPIKRVLFNYLVEYKSLYLVFITFLIFVYKYTERKIAKFYYFFIIFAVIGFFIDLFIYNRSIRLNVYKLFNFILFVPLIILFFDFFIYYFKKKIDRVKDILLALLVLEICLINDLISFQAPQVIKLFLPSYISLKYLMLYGFLGFVILLGRKMILILINSFFVSANLSKELITVQKDLNQNKYDLVKNLKNLATASKKNFRVSNNLKSLSEKFKITNKEFYKILIEIKQFVSDINENEEEIIKSSYLLKEKIEKIRNIINELEDIFKNLLFFYKIIIENTFAIDNIVEQTTLLSLNSSVEAYKAKEKGKGFSVVSDEIRKLANKSSEFSSEIKDKLYLIQKTIEKTINSLTLFEEIFNVFDVNYNKFYDYLKGNSSSLKELESTTEELVETISKIGNISVDIEKNSLDLYRIAEDNNKIVDKIKIK